MERRKLGAGLYEVQGCGTAVRYICGDGACIRENVSTTGSETSSHASNATTTPQRQGLTEGVHVGTSANGQPGVRLVLRDGTSTLLLTGVPASDPDRVTMEGQDRTGRPITECEQYGLVTADSTVEVSTADRKLALSDLRALMGRLVAFDLCGRRLRVMDREHAHLLAFLDRLDAVVMERGPETVQSTETTGGAVGGSDVEQIIRRELDEKKAAILACLGGEASAIEARWSADGSVGLSVAGRDAGSPVHGCVRAAAGAIQVPEGARGELLHPVAD